MAGRELAWPHFAKGRDLSCAAVCGAGAASITFTDAEIAELNAAVDAIEVQGARLPDGVLAFSGVEAPPKA